MRTSRFKVTQIWPLAAMFSCAVVSVAFAGQGDDPEGGGRRGGSGDASSDDPMSLEDHPALDGEVVDLDDPRGFVDYDKGSAYTESLDLYIVNNAGAAIHDVEIQVHLNNTSSDDSGWDPKNPDGFDNEMWIESTAASVDPGARHSYHIGRSIRLDWKTFDLWLVGYRYDGKDAMESLKHFHRGYAAMEAALRTFGLSFRRPASANAAAAADVRAHADEVRPTLVKWLALPLGRDSAMGYLKHVFAVRALMMLGEPEDVEAVISAGAGVDSGDFDAAIDHFVSASNEEKWSTLEPYPAVWLFGTFEGGATAKLESPGYEKLLIGALDAGGDAVPHALANALMVGERKSGFVHDMVYGLGFAGPAGLGEALDDAAAHDVIIAEGNAARVTMLLSLAARKVKGAESALWPLLTPELEGLVDGLAHRDPAAAKLAEKILRAHFGDARDALLDVRLRVGGAKLGAPEGDALVDDVKKLLEAKRDADYREAVAMVRDGKPLGRAKTEADRKLLLAAAALRALALHAPVKGEVDDDAKALAEALIDGASEHVNAGAISIGERLFRLADRADPKSGAADKLRDALLERARDLIAAAGPAPADLDAAIALIERADPDLESDEAKELKIEALVKAADHSAPSEAEALLEEALEIDPDSDLAKSALSALQAGKFVAIGVGAGVLTSPFWLFGLIALMRSGRLRKFVSQSGGPQAVRMYKGPGLSRFATSEYGLFGQKWSSASTLCWDEIGYVYRRQQTGSPGQISTWLDVIATTRRVSIPLDPGRVDGGQELVDLVHAKCPAAVARSQGGGGVGYRPATHGVRPPASPSGMPVARAPMPSGPSGMPIAGSPMPSGPSGMPIAGAPMPSGPSGMPIAGSPVVAPSSPSALSVVGAPLTGPAPRSGMPVAGSPSGMPVAGAPSGMPVAGAPSGMPGVRAPRPPDGSTSGGGTPA